MDNKRIDGFDVWDSVFSASAAYGVDRFFLIIPVFIASGYANTTIVDKLLALPKIV